MYVHVQLHGNIEIKFCVEALSAFLVSGQSDKPRSEINYKYMYKFLKKYKK